MEKRGRTQRQRSGKLGENERAGGEETSQRKGGTAAHLPTLDSRKGRFSDIHFFMSGQ